MRRRQFIRSALSGSAMVLAGRALAGLATSRAAVQSRSADSRIEVLLNEPIGKIAPEISCGDRDSRREREINQGYGASGEGYSRT